MDDLKDVDWAKPANPAPRSGTPKYASNRPLDTTSYANQIANKLTKSNSGTSNNAARQTSKADPFAGLFSNSSSRTPAGLATLESQKAQTTQSGGNRAGGPNKAQEALVDQFSGLATWSGGSTSPVNQTVPALASNYQYTQGASAAQSKPKSNVQSAEHYRPRHPARSDQKDPFDVGTDDSELFGQAAAQSSRPEQSPAPQEDSYDILGDLGKPVTEIRSVNADKDESSDESMPSRPHSASGPTIYRPKEQLANERANDRLDPRVQQIVDMGFSESYARIALEQNDFDVEAALELLLALQPGKSKQTTPKTRTPVSGNGRDTSNDISQKATDFGSQFYSKASKWFTEGRARVNRAMEDYINESPRDPSKPRWMVEEDQSQNRNKPTQRQPRQSRPSAPSSRTPSFGSTAQKPKSTAKAPVTSQSPSATPDIPVRPSVPRSELNTDADPALLTAINDLRNQGAKLVADGDHANALPLYSQAIAKCPPRHPLRILLLSNRSLCSFKLGKSKACLEDVEEALKLVKDDHDRGTPIRCSGEPDRSIRDLWGKLMIRKAQCLESMEKYTEAKEVWIQAMVGGVPGTLAQEGKRRCEKALAPPPRPQPPKVSTPVPAAESMGPSAPKGRAAEHLAQHQEQQERIMRERQALYESIESRIGTWKQGKEKNLRALLSSLDTVLWEGASWKSVSMADLLSPSKVKINYMKAVSKVHPDKIPQGSTVEMKMIAENVFSTLNEAWDNFKEQNKIS